MGQESPLSLAHAWRACLAQQGEPLPQAHTRPALGLLSPAPVGGCCHCLLQTRAVQPPHRMVGAPLSGGPSVLLFRYGQWWRVPPRRLVSQCPTGGRSYHVCSSAEPCSPEEQLPGNWSWLSGLRKRAGPARGTVLCCWAGKAGAGVSLLCLYEAII